ncbi:hypothetical protein AB0G04_40755 [Actinoplanes sp. NPDC023801]|uniref:hypothetical protein n=1 Tax=Actinoplanes sp. NPDC023801 TaxID=3154595 RepID=UPI00340058F2
MITALTGLLAAVVSVAGPAVPARADPAAAAVVETWAAGLDAADWLIISATQPNGVAMYASGTLTAQPDGNLTTGEVDVLFSDRIRRRSDLAGQPFDIFQADRSTFTITRSGEVIERSTTWGFTQTIGLASIGGQMLGGRGGSIGNTGVASYWLLGVASRPAPATEPDLAVGSLIGGWGGRSFVLTATQGAQPRGQVPVMAFASGTWTPGANGTLRAWVRLLVSNRYDYPDDGNSPVRGQPFPVDQAYSGWITLTADGILTVPHLNSPEPATHSTDLEVVGNVVSGWGPSLHGFGDIPARWVVATDTRNGR